MGSGSESDFQKPVPKWVFWGSLIVVGVLAVVVVLLTFGVLSEQLGGVRVPLIIFLLVVAGVAALATQQIIPWEEVKSRRRWMQPKVLGALTVAVITAFGILADLSGLLGPPGATEEKQSNIERSVERSAADARERLTEINERVQDIDGNGGDETDKDPRAQIVKLTGRWSVGGFLNAVFERDTDLVDKYLQTGMKATTLYKNASVIVYGFQSGLNNDPIALLKTFQANGFKLDEELIDGRILTAGDMFMFDTELTPKNYTGGYQDGVFAGPLMFWIVSKASWAGPTEEDREVLEYLIAQGADCSISRSFLDFNRDLLAEDSVWELYPMIEKCAS